MYIKRHYDISAIPTVYKGIKFRSRLEVMWAVFFDELGYNWKYEYKSYKLPSGWYLPDFYFPSLKVFAEVKPNKLTSFERLKCIELSMMFIDVPILLLVGVPTLSTIKTIMNGADSHELVPMPVCNKYYPFFYCYDFDANYFDETTTAIFKAIDYEF